MWSITEFNHVINTFEPFTRVFEDKNEALEMIHSNLRQRRRNYQEYHLVNCDNPVNCQTASDCYKYHNSYFLLYKHQ